MNRTILLVFTFAVIPFVAMGDESPKPLDKASISFRIGMGQTMSDARFTELLDLFDKYPGLTDEVTLFTTYSHAVQKPELFQRRVEILGKRIAQAKARGYRSGFNVLCIMGHHNENQPTVRGDRELRA